MNRPIAICYDFDGTLCPRYMQEYGYIPQLGVKPKQFWKMAIELANS
ncbi:haloacid dehalogenase-like hydrolase, partial [bacterium]|nr:haloacid dehalogenase-like hydrolase [bacterium]